MEQANPKRQTLFDCTSIKCLEIVENRETESRVVVPGAWGKERVESLCLLGTGFQFYKMKRAVELYGHGSCPIV